MDSEDVAKFLPPVASRLRSLKTQLEASGNKPYIGITQGGSSKDWSGARPAATRAKIKESSDDARGPRPDRDGDGWPGPDYGRKPEGPPPGSGRVQATKRKAEGKRKAQI